MLAALSAKPVGGAAILASAGVGAAVSEWVSIGSGIATIIGCAIAGYGLRRRRRRVLAQLPPPPAQGAPRREWDLWHARCQQFYEDQKGQQ